MATKTKAVEKSVITQILRDKFVTIEKELNEYLFERNDPIHGLALGILSGSNVLFLGPPGTAKSMTVKEWSKRITGSTYFEWLITRFSTPEELLGPISFEGLKTDKHIRVTTHKLPESNFAFLDETFKGNPGILNTLLTIMNERIFFNGPTPQNVNLYCLVGASNEVPDEEDGLDALFDRFHLKFEVRSLQEDSSFVEMLNSQVSAPNTILFHKDILAAQEEVKKINYDEEIAIKLVEIARTLRNRGITVSDRTYRQSLKVIQAEAWLNNHDKIQDEDLEVLKHMLWHDVEEQRKCESIILELVNPDKNKVVSQYEEALKMVNELENMTGPQRIQKAAEVIQKVRGAKDFIQKIIEQHEKAKREATSLKPYLEKINRVLVQLHVKELGANIKL